MPCYHCGKGVLYGRSHTHHRGVAGGRWKKRAPKTQRIFQPNLQRISIIESGKKIRVELCTKCLKRIRKDVTEGARPFLQLAEYQKRESQISKIKDQSSAKSKKL